MMCLWNDGFEDEDIHVHYVSAIIRYDEGHAVYSSETDVIYTTTRAVTCQGNFFQHCAEIPEEQKPRRATNRELSKWLAEGKGACKCSNGYTDTAWNYEFYDETVPDYVKVRKWDDTEWHEPGADYMGIE